MGNHDEMFRKFIPMNFGDIHLINRVVHETNLGKKYLVVHGDAWDGVMKHAKWLSKLGSIAYELLLKFNNLINFFRKLRGKEYWSLAKFLKYKVKNAVKYIGEYEKTVSEYAKRKKYDGIICGHIHHAEDQDFDGVNYLNCGDWVESCTALVENYDGTFEILYWDELRKNYLISEKNLEEIGTKDFKVAS